VTIPDPDKIVSTIDAMVPPAPEPENAVLTDETRVVRWTGPLFAVFSLILLPWTIYIAGSLPSRQVSTNNDAAWAGFDLLLYWRWPARPISRSAGRVIWPRRPLRRPRCWWWTPGSTS